MTIRRFIVAGTLAITAAVALAAGLDLLGLPRAVLLAGLMLAVLALALAAARAGASHDPDGFWLAGRRLSPVGNGAGIATEALSLAAVLGIAGAVLAWGHDGLVHLVGIAAGIALVPLLIATPMRASGAVTLPELIALRFGDGLPRLLALLALLACCLLVAAAQLTALGLIGERLLGLPFAAAVAVAATLAVALVVPGGQPVAARFQPVAWALLAAALVLPVAALVLERTGWPIAQLGVGWVVGDIAALETQLVRRALASPAALKPMLTPYLSLDALNHLGILLGLALGFASLPHIAGRAALAPSPQAARASFAWAALLLLVTASALPALAALARLEIVGLVGNGTRLTTMPAWIIDLGRLGIVEVCGVAALDVDGVVAACRKLPRHPGLLRLQDISINAQMLLLALPRLTGLGFALTALMTTALLAAGLASLLGPLTTAAVSLAHDARGGPPALPDDRRLVTVRWLVVLLALLAAGLALARIADMLTLIVWAAAIAAASLAPVLLLGLRWRRITRPAAIAGLATGLMLSLGYILATRFLAPQFHELFLALADVSPGAQARFVQLKAAVAAAAGGAEREAALAALDAHAQRIVGWWGLKPSAAALLAVPVATAVVLLVSLLTARAGIISPAAFDGLARPGRAAPAPDTDGRPPQR